MVVGSWQKVTGEGNRNETAELFGRGGAGGSLPASPAKRARYGVVSHQRLTAGGNAASNEGEVLQGGGVVSEGVFKYQRYVLRVAKNQITNEPSGMSNNVCPNPMAWHACVVCVRARTTRARRCVCSGVWWG